MTDATGAPSLPSSGRGIGRIHHVAVVVRSLDRALPFWRDLLGLPLGRTAEIDSDGVRIAFLPVGEAHIELVEPVDPGTGVARYLEKHGEGVHHLCFEVPRLAEVLAALAAGGVELVDQAPRRGAEGPIAFLHPRSCHGVLVELIEAPGGPAWEALGIPGGHGDAGAPVPGDRGRVRHPAPGAGGEEGSAGAISGGPPRSSTA